MKTSRILDLLKNNRGLLQDKFGVNSIAIFGSYAANNQTNNSDIDIFVELFPKSKTFDNFMELKFYLEDMLGKKIDLITKESLRSELSEKITREAIYA